MFRKIKAKIAPDSIGFRGLCPTRWTVKGESLQSIYEKYEVLQKLWDECFDIATQLDIKAGINGVKAQNGKI